MPTYDYHCQRCGDMEMFQSIREDALAVCPTCGSKRFKRQISRGGGVIFKGSGFYETDYGRSSDYASKSKGETPATPATEAPKTPAPAKTETPAPAAKPAAKSGTAAA